MEANPVLYSYYRGPVAESVHRGCVCIVDQDGSVPFALGDPYQLTYPRSALKFFQQIPLVESGAAEALGLTKKELALTCGSHNGEEAHVKGVRSILAKAGLDETALQCGPQLPSRHRDRLAFYKADYEPAAVYNNCSGKHAGFLALCRYWNCSTDDYLDYEHPVQQAVRQAVAAMHDTRPADLILARDGCSAPIFGLSLYQQALGYNALGARSQRSDVRGRACHQLISAVQAYPFMIAGSRRYCTQLLEATSEPVIGKTGAEGIFGLTLPERGLGLAIKIDDGRMGPQYAVAQHLLKKLGVEGIGQLDSFEEGPLTNLNDWQVGSKGVEQALFPENITASQA